MATKADIKAYVEWLTQEEFEEAEFERVYRETFEELARLREPPIYDCELVTLTAGTGAYAYPDKALSIRAVFFENRQLANASKLQILELFGDTWSGADPEAWSVDEQDERVFYLYPEPATSTTVAMWIDPIGADYPDDVCAALYAALEEDRVSDWLEAPIALNIASRLTAHPGEKQDTNFADTGRLVSDLLFALLGVSTERMQRGKATV